MTKKLFEGEMKEALNKLQQWEIEVWATDEPVELYLDDVTDLIDAMTILKEQTERVQELEEESERYQRYLHEARNDVAGQSRLLREEQHQNKRYRATINAMGQILKDAIHALDVGEKVQGLEYGVVMRDEALESKYNE